MPPCTKCTKTFSGPIQLARHTLGHQRKKQNSCPLCGKTFDQAGNLRSHMMAHIGKLPAKSSNKKPRKEAEALKTQIISDADVKTFDCRQCNYSTTSSCDNKQHKKAHIGEKSYKCNQCNYSSIRSDRLRDHRMTHTGEKQYKCSQCDYSSITSSEMKRHQMVHSRETLQVQTMQVFSPKCCSSQAPCNDAHRGKETQMLSAQLFINHLE